MMTNTFLDDTKNKAKEIIALSESLNDELETWNDVVVRVSESTSKDVSVGYVSKPDASSGIELVLDIQAPPEEDWARLRIWAIETTTDEAGNERFNNVQLTFSLDRSEARRYVEDQSRFDRSVLARILDEPSTSLTEIVISDLTGKDESTGERLGRRQEIEPEELEKLSGSDQERIIEDLSTIIGRLKLTATDKTK